MKPKRDPKKKEATLDGKETVDEFLARGGQIHRIPKGISSYDAKTNNSALVINPKKLRFDPITGKPCSGPLPGEESTKKGTKKGTKAWGKGFTLQGAKP